MPQTESVPAIEAEELCLTENGKLESAPLPLTPKKLPELTPMKREPVTDQPLISLPPSKCSSPVQLPLKAKMTEVSSKENLTLVKEYS